MSNKYRLAFFLLLTMLLIGGIFFGDCKNFPINIDLLPGSLIGITLVIYAFTVAAALIITTLQFFIMVKGDLKNPHLRISRGTAMAFLAGVAIYICLLRLLSMSYCH